MRKGAGTFVLPLNLHSPGKPHVSLYDAETNQPLAGVYFGSDEWLLAARPDSAE